LRVGGLVVIGPAFICCLAGLALVGWLGCWLLARHQRVLAAVPVALLAVVFSLATAADLVNAHYAYLPRLNDVLGVPSWPTGKAFTLTTAGSPLPTVRSQGEVVTLSLDGRQSGFGAHPAMVYLPPQYFAQPARRFPVVYLLHGSPGVPVDWFRADMAAATGLDAAQSGNPLILVAPTMSRRWSADSECVDGPHGHLESYLVDDVVPQIDRTLRTVAGRDSRAVAGNSAGGYCALNLGLRHRGMFGTIIDLSGYTRPTYAGGMRGLFGAGPGLQQQVTENTPARYAARLAAQPHVRLWLDCGRSDAVPLADITAITPILRSRGQDVIVQLRAGGHEHYVWRAALQQAVLWASPALQPTSGTGNPVSPD
jgi:enterochelin esterase-like enzyme